MVHRYGHKCEFCVKLDKMSFKSMEVRTTLVIISVHKGRQFNTIAIHTGVSHSKNVALMMFNKFIKFNVDNLTFVKAMSEV